MSVHGTRSHLVLMETQSFGSPYLGFKQGRSLFVFPNVITLESAKSPEKIFEEFNTYFNITAVIRPAEYQWSDDENSFVFVAMGVLEQNTPNNEGVMYRENPKTIFNRIVLSHAAVCCKRRPRLIFCR